MSSGAAQASLVFPSGIDTFSIKYDRNVLITGEVHTIPLTPSYNFYLGYVPLSENPSSISIPGYTEVSGIPATFQFQTIYSGVNAGLLTFNSLQSGLSVTVDYTTYGDTVKSEMLNSLQTAVVNVESFVLANIASGSYVNTSGGTMTGPLVMGANISLAAGNVIPQTSGNNSVGSAVLPLANLYSNNINTNAVDSTTSMIIKSNGDLNLSGNSIVALSNFVPIPTGNLALGSIGSSWSKIYVNQLASNITLASGINIIVSVSGSNNIGTSSNPISTLFADNVVSSSILTGLSGLFVDVSGGTMTGDLTMSPSSKINTYLVNNTLGALTLSASTLVNLNTDFVPINSGTQNLGTSSLPFDTLYVKNISGGVISGNFISKTGDVMSGDLELPLGTELKVYTITSSIPSGVLNINSSQLNIETTSNVSFTSYSNQVLEIGLAGIYVSTSVVPTSSGTCDIGSMNNPVRAIYADNFYYLNDVSGASFLNPTINGILNLASGTVIVPNISGSNNLGSPSNPIGTIYADNVITSATSGTYVSKLGDSMTGNLVMTSADITTSVSGNNNLGSATMPFANVFANNLETNFLHASGDISTGPFGVNNIYAPTGTLDLQGDQANVTSNVGPIILDGNTEVQILQNGNAGLVVSSSGVTTFSDFVPNTAGIHSVGTITKPWLNIYSDYINGVSSAVIVSGLFVPISGGTMTGDLTMTTDTSVIMNPVKVGYQNIASGANSTAVGFQNIASGDNSTSLGFINDALGMFSTAVGFDNNSIGSRAVAIGYQNAASGDNSSALGFSNVTSGINSSAVGGENYSLGYATSSIGFLNISRETSSSAIGNQNHATNNYSSAIGFSNAASGVNSSAFGCLNIAINSGTQVLGKNVIGTLPETLYIGAPSGVMIQSGKNLFPEASGIQNIGSMNLPFSGIFGGPILQSPDGSWWRLTVSNLGVISGVSYP